MEEEIFSDKKGLVSEYNEASFQILRLHNLWTDYHRYMKEGEYHDAHETLENVWVELSADAKGKNEKKYFGGISLLNRYIGKYKDEFEKLKSVLKLKAIFLKSLQEDVGKGSKKAERHEHM